MRINTLFSALVLWTMLMVQISAQGFDNPDASSRESFTQNPPKYLLYLSTKYQYEFLAIAGLLIYISNYFVGKRKNFEVVRNWLDVNKVIFDNNFSHLGVSPLQNGALLDEESTSMYKFYASGRINCHFCICTFDLKKRQDLVTMLAFNIFWPEKDRIIIDIPLDIPTPQPVVFSVLRKREVKNQHANNPDFKYFCRKIKSEGLTESLVVLAENEETVDFLLDSSVVALLNKFDKNIQMIYITDQKSVYNYPLTMRVVFQINDYSHATLEQQAPLLKLVFYLLDKLSTFKLSSASRQKAEKERQYVDELKLREKKDKIKEELQNKKAEKKKEEEARAKLMPLDKLRKKEEKEHKKNLKKSLPRKIMKF